MMMSQQLDDYLDKPFSDDFWSDYASEQAIAMVQELTPAEFVALRSTWLQRSTAWQIRYADIILWASAPRQEIASVLLEMVQFQNDELTISAADTLREFDPALVAAAMTTKTVHRLREVAQRNPGLSAGAIQRLLDGLPDTHHS